MKTRLLGNGAGRDGPCPGCDETIDVQAVAISCMLNIDSSINSHSHLDPIASKRLKLDYLSTEHLAEPPLIDHVNT